MANILATGATMANILATGAKIIMLLNNNNDAATKVMAENSNATRASKLRRLPKSFQANWKRETRATRTEQ